MITTVVAPEVGAQEGDQEVELEVSFEDETFE